MGHPTKLWQRWSRWSTPTVRSKGRYAWTRPTSWRQGRNSSGAETHPVVSLASANPQLQCYPATQASLCSGEHTRFKIFREEALVQLEEAAVAEGPLGGRLQAVKLSMVVLQEGLQLVLAQPR